MAIPLRHELLCDCGSEDFVPLVHKVWGQVSGTITVPAGDMCADCKKKLNTRDLIAKAQLRAKRAEMDAMEKEVQSMEGASPIQRDPHIKGVEGDAETLRPPQSPYGRKGPRDA